MGVPSPSAKALGIEKSDVYIIFTNSKQKGFHTVNIVIIIKLFKKKKHIVTTIINDLYCWKLDKDLLTALLLAMGNCFITLGACPHIWLSTSGYPSVFSEILL